MRPSPPLGTTGDCEYSPEARWGRVGGRARKLVNLPAAGTEKASGFTPSTLDQTDVWPPDAQRQQRAPPRRASSTPGAGPSCPPANQARTPTAGRNSTRDSEHPAEAAKAVLNCLGPLGRMAGSGTEAMAFRITGTDGALRRLAQKLGAYRPAAGRPASGPSRPPCAAGCHRGRIATQHGPPGPAGVPPPLPATPGPEAAPVPHMRPRHVTSSDRWPQTNW